MSEPNTNHNLKEILNFTEMLTGGGQYRLSWEDIRNAFDELLQIHCSMKYSMESDWTIFRGRIDNETKLFDNINQLTNRKDKDIKDYGRCHKPLMSVFYGANNINTVLSELQPEIGNRVHIAKAKQKTNKEIALTAIGELDRVRRYGKGLFNNDIKEFMSILDNIQDQTNLKRIFLDAFMSELFIKPASKQQDYKATSAISNFILSKDIDGFAYPSVAHRGGINFAILGTKFEQKMEIYECLTFEIIDYLGYGLYNFTQKEKSKTIDKNGNIEWEI